MVVCSPTSHWTPRHFFRATDVSDECTVHPTSARALNLNVSFGIWPRPPADLLHPDHLQNLSDGNMLD